MPKITILKDKSLAVIVQIDVIDYLQSYLDYKANREAIESAEKFKENKLILNELINRELLWLDIKKELASRIINNNTLSNIFREKNESKLPLVLRSLNNSFTELLKNSIDAYLKNNLIKGTNDLLKMSIDMTLVSDQLVINISDNAGGFSADYLRNFNDYVCNKGYKFHPKSSSKLESERELFLGGAGKGIPIFLSLLLDGEIREGKENYLKIVEITSQASIKIQNIMQDMEIGMKMTISSSLEPCKDCQNSLQEKVTNLIDSRFSRPRLPSLSFFKFKKKEQSDEGKKQAQSKEISFS
jgi:hypothetical protein